jgi:16S rRNA (adenine1518-N6/adenine1519-N6)-dimethyltransferase
MTLTEMRLILKKEGILLTKSLGQNFLHDANQVERIVAAAELSSDDQVLEIGPGLGPLTQPILAQAGRVLAVDVDARLIDLLKRRFPNEDHLELVCADALAWLRENNQDWWDWKLVSNLPYSVGSPILVELALCQRPPSRLVVTVQAEVARRIEARNGTPDYGVLTVLLALRYEVLRSHLIPRTCFFPVPNVDSAAITLRRRAQPLVSEAVVPLYVRIVKLGFGQRRKMFPKLLRGSWSREQIEAVFERLNIPLTIRAEKLACEQFAGLANAFAEG